LGGKEEVKRRTNTTPKKIDAGPEKKKGGDARAGAHSGKKFYT